MSRSSAPEVLPPRTTPGTLFVQFIAFPVLIVLPVVGLIAAFANLAHEGRGCLDDLRALAGSAATPNARWQAAYALAQGLRPGERCRGEVSAADLGAAYDAAGDDDPRVRRFLVLAMGLLGDRAAVPRLLDALESPDEEARIYAIQALGALGDPAARPRLEVLLADRDAGLRKAAAYALGAMGPEAIPALRAALADPIADVRWNAALALARNGDAGGLEVIGEMLDRGRVASALTADGAPVSAAQIEAAILEAIKAVVVLGALEREDIRSLLRNLAEGDPSLRVRSAALEALDTTRR